MPSANLSPSAKGTGGRPEGGGRRGAALHWGDVVRAPCLLHFSGRCGRWAAAGPGGTVSVWMGREVLGLFPG